MPIWGRVIDNQVFQEVDIDPATLFTPEELVNWQELPEGVTIGSIFFEDKWWSGGDYLEEMNKRNPPPEEPLLPVVTYNPGGVMEVEIEDAGNNYAPISNITNQFDLEDAKGLVLKVDFGPTGSASNVTINLAGQGYKVGDIIEIKENYNATTWDFVNPMYAKIKITKIWE